MWQLAEAKFAPIALSSTETPCPTTYFITDVNFERTEIDHKTMILVNTAVNPIVIQGVFRETQQRFYYIRAIVKNVNNNLVVLTSEDKYFVKVSNPCVKPNQIVD